jgi:hypothetical protein
MQKIHLINVYVGMPDWHEMPCIWHRVWFSSTIFANWHGKLPKIKHRGGRKCLDGLLLKLPDEEQNSFAMFGYTLHHSPQQDENMRSAHRTSDGEAIFRNFPSNP